jgi:hypothetical protein
MTRALSPAQDIEPVISVRPRGDGVRIYATIMPTEEKVRLLRLALTHVETQGSTNAQRHPEP